MDTSTSPVIMRPVFGPSIKHILASPSPLFEAIERHGGPLAIALPDEAQTAAEKFKALFEELRMQSKVFVAHKATNSVDTLAALRSQVFIDVASRAELAHAFSIGYTHDEIIATGPKSQHFLAELIAHDIPVCVDSHEELLRLRLLLANGLKDVKVLLRLTRSVLNMPSITKRSRFGLDTAAYEKALAAISEDKRFVLLGISFHLDSQSADERYYAIMQAAKELIALQDKGYSASVLDIGGGYGASYGINRSQVDRFEAGLKQAILDDGDTHTWQHFTYGLSRVGNAISGALHGIDAPAGAIGVDRLREVLVRESAEGGILANFLNENLIEIWIEPGAAILSEAGAVVTEIMEVKQLDGEILVVVDAHRNQVCFENNEALLDPILIKKHPESSRASDVFIAGNLCAENDMMTYRKIRFDDVPRAGDLLLWTHTGAYRAHFSASQAIGHALAKQLTYEENANAYTLSERTS